MPIKAQAIHCCRPNAKEFPDFQLGGVHPRSIANHPDGTFDIDELKELVRADDPHFPITSLVCIESTHNLKGGRVLPLEWIDQVVLIPLCSS